MVDVTESHWSAVVGELTDLARGGDHESFGRLTCRLLSEGRVADLATAVDAHRATGLPLAVEVLRADLAIRDQTISFHALRDLDKGVQASGLPAEFAEWTGALLAEWGLWRGDFSTFGYAHSTGGPSRASDGELGAMVGGRRRRIGALMLAVTEPHSAGAASALAEVQELLGDAGAVEELAITDVMLGYARLSISDDPSHEHLATIRRGVTELERLAADRLGVGLGFLAWGAYMVGDFTTAEAALDRFRQVAPAGPPLPPLVEEGVAILRALAHMAIEGPTTAALEDLRTHIGRLRRTTLPSWMLGPVANDLLDAGQVDFAAEILDAVGPGDPFVLAADLILREVDTRIRIQRDGDHAAVQDLWDLYGDFEIVGRTRRAAASAVRCAWTCRAAGFDDDAARLTRWGLHMLPTDPERTPWERAYIAGGDPAKRWVPARRGTLRVLAPQAVLMREDDPVELHGAASLLLGLLAAARGPTPIPEVAGAIWPDLDLADSRERLAEVVHRLRDRFDLLPGELIHVEGDEIAIDARGWVVDVREFRDLTGSGDDRRARALDLYESDLIASQRNAGSLLTHHRDELRTRWLEALQSLVISGQLSKTEARARSRRVAPGEDLDVQI